MTFLPDLSSCALGRALVHLGMAALGTSVWGQDPREEPEIAQIIALMRVPVITASRFRQVARDAPATLVVVTEKQIRQRGYRSILDVLQDLPDFKTERGVHEHYYTSLSVRGLPGPEKFVLMIDGTRITGPTNEPLPLFENIPVHMVRQIEVVYGPASALYGADAVSGVVNLITKEHDALETKVAGGPQGLTFGNLFYAVTARPGLSFRLAAQAFQDHPEPLDGAYPDYRGFQSHRTGNFLDFGGHAVSPRLPFDTTPSFPLKAEALWLALRAGDFDLSYFRNQSRFPSSVKNRPDYAIYNDDTFIGHGLQVFGGTYRLQLDGLHCQGTAAYARYDLNPNSAYRDVFGYYDRAFKYAHSSSFRLEGSVDATLGPALRIIGGGTYESFDALPWSADLTAPVNPDQEIKGSLLGSPDIPADFFRLTYQNLGAYLQAQYGARDALKFTFGARLDHNSRYGSSFNPRFGLVWKPAPATTLKALYGTAFLAPSPYEAYLHYGAFTTKDGGQTYTSGFWRLPNPNLHPIRARTAGLGLDQALGRTWHLSMSLYESRYRNLFAQVPDGTYTHLYNGRYKGWPVDFIVVETNLGDQVSRGGSLTFAFAAPPTWANRVTSQITYSHVDGRVDPLGDGREVEIERIAPDILKATLEVTFGAWSLAPRILWMGPQRVVELQPGTDRRYRLPGYARVDAHLRWEWALERGTLAFVGDFRNAFSARTRNINYEARPGDNIAFFGVPQELRRVSLGLEARF